MVKVRVQTDPMVAGRDDLDSKLEDWTCEGQLDLLGELEPAR